MERILEALFDGNLLVDPVIEKRSPKYQEAGDAARVRIEELQKKLNPEEQELLEEIVDALAVENDCYNVGQLARSYRLGALMMLEIMEGKEDFILTRRID